MKSAKTKMTMKKANKTIIKLQNNSNYEVSQKPNHEPSKSNNYRISQKPTTIMLAGKQQL